MSPVTRDTIAGSIGGMVSNCFFVTPDLLKSRAQMTKDGKLSYTREFSRIMQQDGCRGLFRGFWATFWRDVPTWGIYFGCYTKFKEWVTTENPFLRVLGTMHAAGMAGAFCWIFSIPQDVIKNK